MAYALNGYSAHIGYRTGDLRADLGVFAADVPESFHRNSGWTEHTNGVGAKLDCLCSGKGIYVGIEANYSRTRYTFRETEQTVSRSSFDAGIRVGYRYPLDESRMYIAPWLGIDYNFGRVGAVIDGHTFDEKRIGFFLTIHVGWVI